MNKDYRRENLANPLIPEGKYKARCLSHKVTMMFGDPKLVLDFQITDFGEYFKTVIPRYYSVKKIKGSSGFKPLTKTCSLIREWFLCHPDSPRNMRFDRIPMSQWSTGEYEIMATTVIKNFQQKPLPEQLRYSRVSAILGRAP